MYICIHIYVYIHFYTTTYTMGFKYICIYSYMDTSDQEAEFTFVQHAGVVFDANDLHQDRACMIAPALAPHRQAPFANALAFWSLAHTAEVRACSD